MKFYFFPYLLFIILLFKKKYLLIFFVLSIYVFVCLENVVVYEYKWMNWLKLYLQQNMNRITKGEKIFEQ